MHAGLWIRVDIELIRDPEPTSKKPGSAIKNRHQIKLTLKVDFKLWYINKAREVRSQGDVGYGFRTDPSEEPDPDQKFFKPLEPQPSLHDPGQGRYRV